MIVCKAVVYCENVFVCKKNDLTIMKVIVVIILILISALVAVLSIKLIATNLSHSTKQICISFVNVFQLYHLKHHLH